MKKGFTLIELLAVIIILGVILAIAFITMNNIIKNSRIDLYNEEINKITDTAEMYISNGNVGYIEEGETVEITLDELIADGYIKEVKSPLNKSKICNGYVLVSKLIGGDYSYNPHINCEEDINNSTEDKLLLHYTFDDFQEPTTNVVTNTNLNTGWSQGYQTNIVFNEILPPDGVNSPTVGFDRGLSNGYWYSYGDYAPQVQGKVYTVSLYVKTLDSNFNINFYTADNSETGRYWSEYMHVPNDGQWHRIVWNSFTNPSNSQSSSLSFNFSFANPIGSPNTRTWLCAPQMEQKSYATPFVIGSRTGKVKDYSINGNFTNLNSTTTPKWVGDSEQNNNYYKFNGVDRYLSTTPLTISSDITLSVWINRTDTTNIYVPLIEQGGTRRFRLTRLYNRICFGNDSATANYYCTANLFGDTNRWYYIVATSKSGSYNIYVDGVNYQLTNYTNSYASWVTANLNIGYRVYDYSVGPFNGYMDDVRIYNRALNQKELYELYISNLSNYE